MTESPVRARPIKTTLKAYSTCRYVRRTTRRCAVREAETGRRERPGRILQAREHPAHPLRGLQPRASLGWRYRRRQEDRKGRPRRGEGMKQRAANERK